MSGLVGNSRRHVLSCRGSFVFVEDATNALVCTAELFSECDMCCRALLLPANSTDLFSKQFEIIGFGYRKNNIYESHPILISVRLIDLHLPLMYLLYLICLYLHMSLLSVLVLLSAAYEQADMCLPFQ